MISRIYRFVGSIIIAIVYSSCLRKGKELKAPRGVNTPYKLEYYTYIWCIIQCNTLYKCKLI